MSPQTRTEAAPWEGTTTETTARPTTKDQDGPRPVRTHDDRTHDKAAPTWNPNRWRALPIILTATFMSLFDVFVVNVAAPTISSDLHASSAGLELVVAGYSFTFAAGLVTGGRLGDRFGRRGLFLLGMALFTVASAMCGVANNETVLIAGRLLQGSGAALMIPQVLALISVTFPPHERSRAFAMFGVAVGLGSVSGQILGGILLDLNIAGLGWRPIFLVNVPIGIGAIWGARKLVAESRAVDPQKLDPIGLVGLTAGLGLLLVPLVLGRDEGWPAWTWISLAGGVVTLGLFVVWEARLARSGGHPIAPPAVLRTRQVLAGLATSVGFFMFFGSFMLAFTLFLQDGQHRTPLDAGLTFGPLGIAFALSSLAARRLVDVHGPRVLTAGAAISFGAVLGIVLMLGADGASVSAAALTPLLMLIGVGNGLVIPSLIAAVLATAPADSSGAIGGVLATTQQFASALGVAAIGAVYFSSTGASSGLHAALLCDLGVLGLAIVATLFLPRVAPPADPGMPIHVIATRPGGRT